MYGNHGGSYGASSLSYQQQQPPPPPQPSYYGIGQQASYPTASSAYSNGQYASNGPPQAPYYGSSAASQPAPVAGPSSYGSSSYAGQHQFSSPPPPHQPTQQQYGQYGQQQQQHQYHHHHHHQQQQLPQQQRQEPPQPVMQQPPPFALRDPNAFRSFYANELRQLTFNSKPLINHLTIVAGEHASSMAHVIAQCLEDHVKQSPPNVKLTALYLLDSVCKNIGPPYTLLFARTIDRIFLAAYREVDDSTKVKFEELLGTWRNAAPDGGELFKLPASTPQGIQPAQRIMEDTLFGPPVAPTPVAQLPHPSAFLLPSKPVAQQGPPPQYQPQSPPNSYPATVIGAQRQSSSDHRSPPSGLPALPPQLAYPSRPSAPQPQQAPSSPQHQHQHQANGSLHNAPPPGLPAMPPQAISAQSSANHVERAAVLFDLRKLLNLRRETASQWPGDRNNHEQIQTLEQLEGLILNTELQAAQFSQIREQLARLTPINANGHPAQRVQTPPFIPHLEASAEYGARERKRQRLVSPPPPRRLSSPPSPAFLENMAHSPRSGQAGFPQPAVTYPHPNTLQQHMPANLPQPPQYALPPHSNHFASQALPMQHQQAMPMQHQNGQLPSSLPVPLGDLASLTQLLNSDIIRSASAQGALGPPRSQSPPDSKSFTGTPIPSHAQPHGSSKLQHEVTFKDNILLAAKKAATLEAIGRYDAQIMDFHVSLQNSDISRYRPGSSSLIYEAMPVRCKQCGNRYLDCPLGKERFERDLDRHLRLQKRYNDGVSRGAGRSWFVNEDEWVLPPSAIQPSEAVVKAEEVKKKAAFTAELLNKTVLVPAAAATNEELMRCSICKEQFKNEYSEADEDWVWRNAVEVDGVIYHATCKAEQESA